MSEAANGQPDAPLLPLQARDLGFGVDGTTLIDGLTLTLEAGPLTVLMGPNGAGKSLLLRLLHGLIAPTAGRVTWGSNAPSKARRQEFAMVFQTPVLLRRSVGANIRFAMRLRGRAGSERLAALLRRVRLEDVAARPALRLSGGEQQRLALARALALEPTVLFLDEPTASLDPASTKLIEDLVLTTSASGTKVVFVTHDIGQAQRLADEVVFLHRGRVRERTPAENFFNRPASSEARAFLAGQLLV